jgi:hypothetical protein
VLSLLRVCLLCVSLLCLCCGLPRSILLFLLSRSSSCVSMCLHVFFVSICLDVYHLSVLFHVTLSPFCFDISMRAPRLVVGCVTDVYCSKELALCIGASSYRS